MNTYRDRITSRQEREDEDKLRIRIGMKGETMDK